MLDLFVVDEAMVDALKRDRLVWQYRGHGISCRHAVREAKHDQRPFPNDGTSLSSARSTVTSVDSLPISAPATSKWFSGSSESRL
jgi:hypothetical protein